jgi:REP element-mobilizing transposase RayT
MPKSLIVSYNHIIWATRHRAPTLTREVEPIILHSLKQTCDALGLGLLAANGAWDHLHLLIRWHPSVCFADAVRMLKVHAILDYNAERLDNPHLPPAPSWQGGYSLFSLREQNAPIVRRYIQRQKQHHRCPDSLIPALERCPDE